MIMILVPILDKDGDMVGVAVTANVTVRNVSAGSLFLVNVDGRVFAHFSTGDSKVDAVAKLVGVTIFPVEIGIVVGRPANLEMAHRLVIIEINPETFRRIGLVGAININMAIVPGATALAAKVTRDAVFVAATLIVPSGSDIGNANSIVPS